MLLSLWTGVNKITDNKNIFILYVDHVLLLGLGTETWFQIRMNPKCKEPGTRSKNGISVLLIGSKTWILHSVGHVICLDTS